MTAPISPRRHQRAHARSSPPNRPDSLAPHNLAPLRATGAHRAHHHLQIQEGPIVMLDRSQIDAAIFRVAVAAFTYYPDKATNEPGYTIDEDLDWCLRPLRHLPAPQRQRLREQITGLITDPTADRQTFIQHLHHYAQERDQ
jgi:hypothetical protein